jgi:glutamate/aspartate transport system ATP-binding protein
MWQLSATEVVKKLKTGEVSPLEIVDVAIARIQKVEPHINALPIQFFEEARDIAKKFKRPKNPSLGWLGMLFDEPTSALDPEMINEVLDVMIDLAQEGMTMIVVTHEMGFARKVADRVIFMDLGCIVEDCSKTEFFTTQRSERAQTFLQKIIH